MNADLYADENLNGLNSDGSGRRGLGTAGELWLRVGEWVAAEFWG